MSGPEPIRVRRPPPRVGAVGRELRKLVEQRLQVALEERGWRTAGSRDHWLRADGMEPPLRAQLGVDVDSPRYEVVRIAAAVEVAASPVEELLAAAPDEVLTETQRTYRPRLGYPLAVAGFGRVDGVPRQEPLQWQARDETQLEQAVGGFLAHLDGPVRTWLEQRSTIDGVRVAADTARHGGRGAQVRTVAALEALRGDLSAARARLARYREDPGSDDGPEQVAAFGAWLEQAVAARGTGA